MITLEALVSSSCCLRVLEIEKEGLGALFFFLINRGIMDLMMDRRLPFQAAAVHVYPCLKVEPIRRRLYQSET